MAETFDGVSVSRQDKKKCIMFLQLSSLKVSKGLLPGKNKPGKNTEISSPVTTDSEIIITAKITSDDGVKTYKWEKNHAGKIAKCDVEPEPGQLKLTLTKSEPKDWGDTFLDYLQEI